MKDAVEERLAKLGVTLSTVPKPVVGTSNLLGSIPGEIEMIVRTLGRN